MVPFFAFTTLNKSDYALVCQSTAEETWQAVKTRAEVIITEIASGATSSVDWNRLHANLRVISYTDAIQEPYRIHLTTPFNLEWLQAQADAVRRQGN